MILISGTVTFLKAHGLSQPEIMDGPSQTARRKDWRFIQQIHDPAIIYVWQEPVAQLEAAHCRNHEVAGSSHFDI